VMDHRASVWRKSDIFVVAGLYAPHQDPMQRDLLSIIEGWDPLRTTQSFMLIIYNCKYAVASDPADVLGMRYMGGDLRTSVLLYFTLPSDDSVRRVSVGIAFVPHSACYFFIVVVVSLFQNHLFEILIERHIVICFIPSPLSRVVRDVASVRVVLDSRRLVLVRRVHPCLLAEGRIDGFLRHHLPFLGFWRIIDSARGLLLCLIFGFRPDEGYLDSHR
jgi:hypothetical protein